jgi:small-conductance mechanosensitive channel
MQLLDTSLYGNTVRQWVVAVGIGLAVFVALRLVAWAVRGLEAHRQKTATGLDDILAIALRKTHTLVLLVAGIWAGSATVALPSRVQKVVNSVAVIAFLVQGGLWVSAGIVEWVGLRREAKLEEDAAGVMSLKVLSVAVRLALWSMVVLLALSNLGVDVTALVAGLGVGGVAVALAAQGILGDVFASIFMVIDKPFVLGDFLVIGDFLGSVEDIGMRTTRIRSLSGEQLVFSNNDLLRTRIRNYGCMYQRRVVFSLGVTYQTPRAKLEAIPGIIREAIEGQDKTRFDRAHFQKYGDFALVFERGVRPGSALRTVPPPHGRRATTTVEGSSRQTQRASKPAAARAASSSSRGKYVSSSAHSAKCDRACASSMPNRAMWAAQAA